ncbi:hypothetical protein HDU83_002644 [Entophlyctis luteolus]|nr:hypothetical protein HDU83_002644 [Entophlyctis luteolus]KAJ3385759.1 hypothetical protein HDU84_002050 [Entophlyctis sp. JEL0112]
MSQLRHVRAQGTLDEAIQNGGTISSITTHANDPAKATVYVKLRRNDKEVMFPNVDIGHATALTKQPTEHSYCNLAQQAKTRVSRQEGSIEEAYAQGAFITDIKEHGANSQLSVTVGFPDQGDMKQSMVFTSVSLGRLQELGKVYPEVYEALEKANLHMAHSSKLSELMKEPGTLVASWHPRKQGSHATYSVIVKCADGSSRPFPNVSEQNLAQYVPNFVRGSTME